MRLLFQFAIVCIFLCSIARASSEDLEKLFFADPIWSGGDGAYSVALGEHRVLWLFGDSFLGTIGDGTLSRRMIHNALAIQNPIKGSIRFYWSKKTNEEAFFYHKAKPEWLWPGDAVYYQKKLYCFQKIVETVKTKKDDPFGFKWVADEIIMVSNPQDDPTSWKTLRFALPSPAKLHVGTATFAKDGYIYTLGINEENKQAFMARIAVNKLKAQTKSEIEYLSFQKKPCWSRTPSEISYLWNEAAAEASLSVIPGGYLCVYSQNGMNKNILGRTCKLLDGKWSAAKVLYEIPEAQLKRGYCYAAKAHPEQPAEPGKIIVSYAINPGELKAHQKDPYAYFPHLVSVAYPSCDE